MNKINLRISWVFLILLLLPTKNFYFFYCSVLFLYLISGNIRFSRRLFIISVIILSYLYSFVVVRSLIDIDNFFIDFKELTKIVFVIITIAYYNKNKVGSIELINSFKVFASVNLIFTLVMVFNINIFNIEDILFNIYSLEGMKELIFGGIVRATGVSPGPGEQGNISLLCWALFYNYFLSEKINRKSDYLFLVIPLLTLLFSQSRTAIIAALITFLIVSLVYMFKGNRSQKYKVLKLSSFFTVISLIFIKLLPNMFYYMNLFLIHGTQLASMGGRKEIWSEYFKVWDDQAILIPFGYGRGLLGRDNQVFDNEYVYVTLVFGLVISFFMVLIGIGFLINRVSNWNKSTYIGKAVFTYLIYVFIAGIGLLVISEPKISIVLTILFICNNCKSQKIISVPATPAGSSSG